MQSSYIFRRSILSGIFRTLIYSKSFRYTEPCQASIMKGYLMDIIIFTNDNNFPRISLPRSLFHERNIMIFSFLSNFYSRGRYSMQKILACEGSVSCWLLLNKPRRSFSLIWQRDRARSRSQVYVEYFINLYTSAFIRLPHLYEELYVHSIVIINAGGMG